MRSADSYRTEPGVLTVVQSGCFPPVGAHARVSCRAGVLGTVCSAICNPKVDHGERECEPAV
eukprot:5337868-Amphidinium_carterae.1